MINIAMPTLQYAVMSLNFRLTYNTGSTMFPGESSFMEISFPPGCRLLLFGHGLTPIV